jgi:hypothetical protein
MSVQQLPLAGPLCLTAPHPTAPRSSVAPVTSSPLRCFVVLLWCCRFRQAGTGLLGLVAHYLGASAVLCTEYSRCIEWLTKNVRACVRAFVPSFLRSFVPGLLVLFGRRRWNRSETPACLPANGGCAHMHAWVPHAAAAAAAAATGTWLADRKPAVAVVLGRSDHRGVPVRFAGSAATHPRPAPLLTAADPAANRQ